MLCSHRRAICKLRSCYVPLSCNPLWTPRLAIHSWSRDFIKISSDRFWHDLLRLGAVWSQCSISGHTIWSPSQIRSQTFIQDWPDQVHNGVSIWRDQYNRCSQFGTIWHVYYIYVLIRSFWTYAFCCYMLRLWSRCISQSWSRIITIWATTVQLYTAWLTIDFRVSWSSTK